MKRYSSNHKTTQYYTFMISPPSGKQSLSLRVPSWLIKTIIISFIVLVIGFSSVFIWTSKRSGALVTYKKMKQNIKVQKDQIDQFYFQIEELKDEIDSLFETEKEIRDIVGEPKRKKRRRKKRRSQLDSKRFLKQFKTLSKESSIENQIAFLKSTLTTVKKSFLNHMDRAQHNKARFASTPSIWPVYGYIRSAYGPRRHPITGRRVFHHGVDIPSWRGAPIKAAADGIVKYSGWNGTFGYVVIIDHDFGYRTIYAHASQLLVRRREFVKKGQIIAQIGSTGLSTGSHVHYEVRCWNKPLNPKIYLDLDIYTACTKIW